MEFRLPDVGEGIATAEILTWHVAEGDHVTEHQDLVEIQTDKAVAVIPCPATGVVVRLCGEEGETIDVGAVLAVIEVDGDGAAARRAAAAPAAGAAPPAPAGAARTQLPLAAPSTRRLARELGVALEDVAGSGPHGRITREDVEGAAAAPPPAAPEPAAARAPAPEPGEVIPLRGVRRTIAHALTRAWLEVPRIIDFREVDATALVRARASLRGRALDGGDENLARALTPTPLIVRAAVLAARDNPYVNASIDLEGEQITLHRHYHVGIATAGPDGLTVPVVHDADRLSLAEIALEIVALTSAARERRLTAAQLAGPTFTVNNFGSLGTWMGTPIIRPPEVVNLGVGAIRDRVVAVDGAAVVRPTLVLSVAGDHRVLDGDTLSAFVDQVAGLLEDPVLLFEDLR
jgi:pyruvate/2-oxoglutarate dehydrogenase complex dihydrolipoamide acyltransferase (E2) component